MNQILSDTVSFIVRHTASFIYETPVNIAAVAAAGIAASILAPSFALPLFALAGTATLARIAVQLLKGYNKNLYYEFNEKMSEIDSGFGNLYYITTLAALLLGAAKPLFGTALGAVAGIYKGAITQIKIQITKLDMRQKETLLSYSHTNTNLIGLVNNKFNDR